MFDGPGGLADPNARLEAFLASEVEGAAACEFQSFCRNARGARGNLPPALMRYIAWAAARSLPMVSLFQNWADSHNPSEMHAVEPPPTGWEKIIARDRSHCMEHAEYGIRESVSSEEARSLTSDGWKLRLDRNDVLELMHLQAWYFQVRFFPRLRWLVMESPEDKSFIIGDRPVVWGFRNAVAVAPSMLRHPNVQLIAPLSRSLALFAHHAEGSPPDHVSPEQINLIVAAAASRWVAGSDEESILSVFDVDGTPVAGNVDAMMQDDDRHDSFLEQYQHRHASP
jgi:hypothetical protein